MQYLLKVLRNFSGFCIISLVCLHSNGYAEGLDLSALTKPKYEGKSCPAFTEPRPAVSNGGVLLQDSAVFFPSYSFPEDDGSPHGDIERVAISTQGVLDEDDENNWSAGDLLADAIDNSNAIGNWQNRRIVTFDPLNRNGIPFTADQLADSRLLGNLLLTGNNVGDDIDDALEGLGLPLTEIPIDLPSIRLPCALFILNPPLDGDRRGCSTNPIFAALTTSDPIDLGDLVIPLTVDGLTNLIGLRPSLSIDQINYIRGDISNEGSTEDDLRSRRRAGEGTERILGPVLRSNPVWVGPPAFDYPDGFPVNAAGQGPDQNYSAFRGQMKDRQAVVYVGAADGMLHAFDAETGVELFAFVPSAAMAPLKSYTEQDFISRPYVDGNVSVVDVYLEDYGNCPNSLDDNLKVLTYKASGNCWRTLLLGGLGGGGQAIYALDITNPANFADLAPAVQDHDGDTATTGTNTNISVNAASRVVLWEFTDRSGSLLTDLGTLTSSLVGETACQVLDVDAGQLVRDLLGSILGDGLVTNIAAGVIGPLVSTVTDTLNTDGLCDQLLGEVGAVLENTFDTLNQIISADPNAYGHPGLGYTYGQPNIVRMNDGNWYAAFGNGYGNTDIDLGIEESLNEGLPFAADSIISALFAPALLDGNVVTGSLSSIVQLGFDATGFGYLYLVDLKTGALQRTYETEGVGNFVDLNSVLGSGLSNVQLPDTDIADAQGLLNNLANTLGNANGLATPASVDNQFGLPLGLLNPLDGLLQIDHIYVGDLFGNLWKLDASSENSAEWAWDNNGTPIFSTVDATDADNSLPSNPASRSAQLQTITTQPEVIFHPNQDGYLVLFGTGKLFDESDLPANERARGGDGSNNFVQSIYALWDPLDDDIAFSYTRGTDGNLLERFIWQEETVAGFGTYRLTSRDSGKDSPNENNGEDHGPIDWSEHRGWYFDLRVNDEDSAGERVISDTIIRNNRLLFTSIIPDDEVCENESTADVYWSYTLRARDGHPPVFTPFDVNGDGLLNATDLAEFVEPVGEDGADLTLMPSSRRALQADGGSTAAPLVVITADNREIHISAAGGADNVDSIVSNPAGYERQRSTWVELR